MAPSAIAAMVTAKPCRDLADYWASLCIAASLSGRHWIAEEAGSTLLTPHAFHFVDVGFGIPSTIDPPEEWPLPA